MPFFIQPPPPVEIPRTILEYVQSESTSDLIDVAPVLRNFRLDEDMFENVYLIDKFHTLFNAWKSRTFLQSSVSKIIEDVNFKKIVEMGEKAIPLIIEEIDKNPGTLVWALNLITKTSISPNQRLTVSGACKMWVKLWKQHSFQQIS